MEKLVNQSKLIYYVHAFDEEDIIVEMRLGKRYEVETYAGETGDVVCKFTSELESITIDDDWINKEDYPDGFITQLTFKNGVTTYEPQYDHDAVNIHEVLSEFMKESEQTNEKKKKEPTKKPQKELKRVSDDMFEQSQYDRIQIGGEK